MVVASIDLKGGKVVQLKQGAELVLERDNAAGLAEEFDKYGEVAVIDLDAAIGTAAIGTNPAGENPNASSSNLEIVKSLLRKAQCRVGGGIKTPGQAKELVSLGAKKIIIGSKVFRKDEREFGVNIPLLESFAKKIGRERLIVAVDARPSPGGDSSEIVIDGWKTPTGLELIEAARAVEKYSSELLFTCVEREGTMKGIDITQVKKLQEAVSCSVTAAGGVSSYDEIEELSSLGCDVQLGMALYTGKINLADAFIHSLNWKKGENLLPVIAQAPDGQVLMTGFTDREALGETFKTGNLCFHSRSRNKLWMKGETSGNFLKLLRIRADCDRDAILAIVENAGPVCHTGAWTCFETGRSFSWEFLQKIIEDRFRNPVAGSYTATLNDTLVREKLMEEAEELCEAKTHEEKVWEAADVLYFATALITRSGIKAEEILDELERRHLK